MWRLPQLAFSLFASLSYPFQWEYSFVSDRPAIHASKRIAIVGGGTAGLTMLKTLTADLPAEVTRDWDIVLFEQREDIGGVWLPEEFPPQPPALPHTPLYVGLRTGMPHPSMTLPHFPYPPETILYPGHAIVEEYQHSIVDHYRLSSYIHLNSEVVDARWVGSETEGTWLLTVQDTREGSVEEASFNHLIVASGHNHFPYEPKFGGEDEWLGRIMHSTYYRRAEEFSGRNVVVVGGGASGQDIALRVAPFANSTYISLKPADFRNSTYHPIPGVERKTTIDHFTSHEVVFSDNTSMSHIDTVILATGYIYRIPFLTSSGHLPEVQSQPSYELDDNHLTNIDYRYIRPLYRHVLSLDSSYPLGSLYFLGLPMYVANAPSDSAQALFTAYTISDPTLLDSRETLIADLVAQEEQSVSASQFTPSFTIPSGPFAQSSLARPNAPSVAHVGHRIPEPLEAYQDSLVSYLQDHGLSADNSPGVPPLGRNFTENWRVFCARTGSLLRKGWARVEEMGEEEVKWWVDGVGKGTGEGGVYEKEKEWVDLMVRLVEWEREKEMEDSRS